MANIFKDLTDVKNISCLNGEACSEDDTGSVVKTSTAHRGLTLVICGGIALLLVLLTAFIFTSLHTKTVTACRGDIPGSYASLYIQNDGHGPFIECPINSTSFLELCSFDLLTDGVDPSPCFDADMQHDCLDGKSYGFFEDIEGTRRVQQEIIMQGDIARFSEGLWVTLKEHLHHCRYLLNRSIRATTRESPVIIDTFLDGGHMQHCFRLLDGQESHLILRRTWKPFLCHTDVLLVDSWSNTRWVPRLPAERIYIEVSTFQTLSSGAFWTKAISEFCVLRCIQMSFENLWFRNFTKQIEGACTSSKNWWSFAH